MSSPPIQPDPKETVEAQLCAYLEGDLSPADRAAIEQHLAVHPQHRQLLADLARTRQWLQDLPREPAPPDVGEAFQQQVERSLLLGEDANGSRPTPTAGRAQQVALLAALVLLAAGLGVVLTMMLSGPARPAAKYATAVPPPAPATAPAAPPVAMSRPAHATAPSMANAVPPPAAMGGGGLSASAMPAAAAVRSLHVRVVTADPAAVESILARSRLPVEPAPSIALASRANRGFGRYQANPDLRQNTQAASDQPQAQSNAQANAFAAREARPAGPRRYVLRGLSADQAARLTAALTAAAPGRVSVDGPTTRPAAAGSTLAPGEVVTVVIPQLTGPGVGQTNVVRVAADGTIALPMIDAVPAAGATDDAVARRVADRYRQANLIANPTVTVSAADAPTAAAKAATRPTTGPAPLMTLTIDVEPAPATTSP